MLKVNKKIYSIGWNKYGRAPIAKYSVEIPWICSNDSLRTFQAASSQALTVALDTSLSRSTRGMRSSKRSSATPPPPPPPPPALPLPLPGPLVPAPWRESGFAVTDPRGANPGPALSAIAVGLIIVAIGFALGTDAGYAINPARDFGPRLMELITGYKGAFVDQNGASNTATVDQTGSASLTDLDQLGDFNTATVDQDGGARNSADVEQTGNRNTVKVDQGPSLPSQSWLGLTHQVSVAHAMTTDQRRMALSRKLQPGQMKSESETRPEEVKTDKQTTCRVGEMASASRVCHVSFPPTNPAQRAAKELRKGLEHPRCPCSACTE